MLLSQLRHFQDICKGIRPARGSQQIYSAIAVRAIILALLFDRRIAFPISSSTVSLSKNFSLFFPGYSITGKEFRVALCKGGASRKNF